MGGKLKPAKKTNVKPVKAPEQPRVLPVQGFDLETAAFQAWNAGDRSQVAALLLAHQDSVQHNPMLLQLLALSLPSRTDGWAMLGYSVYDLEHRDSGAFFNLGVFEQERRHDERAVFCYEQALRLEPNHLGALNNLSDLYRRFGRAQEGWALLERYLANGGDPQGLEIRFAKMAEDIGESETAKGWFKRARAHAPHDASVAWEESMSLLTAEDWGAGWQGYEARRHIYDHAALGLVSYPYPEWDGKPLGARSLLLHKEQGLGDMIMFAGCLDDIQVAPRKLHIAVQKPLARLFTINFPQAQVWASESTPEMPDHQSQDWLRAVDQIDCHTPLASIARYTRHNGFATPKAYLKAAPAEVSVWAERLDQLAGPAAGRRRAGLVITARRDGHGGPGVAEGLPKTLPELVAGELRRAENIQWVGLQDRRTVETLAHVPGMDIFDPSPWLFDMADTAALIENLDIVVAVDTAVAHLAGAMGKPVLLMLRQRADWRWGRGRTDCVWYPHVRLFRQLREGDWWTVVDSVIDALNNG